jgi:predicted secreted protein
MHWFTGFVLYVIIWWTVLFAVLPFGTRPVAEADEATGWRGAPERPMIGRKVVMTTLISLVIWGVVVWLNVSGRVSFRSGWLALPDY